MLIMNERHPVIAVGGQTIACFGKRHKAIKIDLMRRVRGEHDWYFCRLKILVELCYYFAIERGIRAMIVDDQRGFQPL